MRSSWSSLAAESIEQRLAWVASQDWGQAMASCLQDPAWHAEGDVWTHTQRVVAELVAMPVWPTLSPSDQTVLFWAAVLHDVAKPRTTQTDPETGHVTSPHHAVRGEADARSILRQLDCDLVTRERIARLVRYHGRPAFVMDRDDPAAEMIKLSWLVEWRLMIILARADTRGRDTESFDRPEETLDYVTAMAEELACYDRPYGFAHDQARVQFFRQTRPDRHYVPHQAYRSTVTMMAGLPGSGKDAWLSGHDDRGPVVSLDAIRRERGIDPEDNQGPVIQAATDVCRDYLRAERPFVFNATNTTRRTRQRWIDLFLDYQARVEIVYLEPPLAVLRRQNRDRVHAVPESVLDRLIASCEPPTWAECHGLTYEPSDVTRG